MNRRSLLALLGSTWCSKGLAFAADPLDDLTAKLEAIRVKHNLPALAAARLGFDGMIYQSVTGVRKAGTNAKAAEKDLWHLGSLTKAMTAALLAVYVQEGRVNWEDELGSIIPDACKNAHPSVKRITISQLLQHRSGLPANLGSWWDLPDADQRGKILAMAAPPDGKPAEPGTFLYSNVGYAIAGHVAEKLGGKPWEALLEQKIFRPLKIKAGQGPPPGPNQPWPHDHGGQPLRSNGQEADNPPSLGPAGRVHASLTDYARFAADQLRGAAGKPALLTPENYQFLHRPDPVSGYACGWRITERPWAGGRVLTHTGSNNANFAVVWLAPEKEFGVIAVCNQGGDTAATACDEACSHLIRMG